MSTRQSGNVKLWLAIIGALGAVVAAFINNYSDIIASSSPVSTSATSQTEPCKNNSGKITAGDKSVIINCASAGGDINVNR